MEVVSNHEIVEKFKTSSKLLRNSKYITSALNYCQGKNLLQKSLTCLVAKFNIQVAEVHTCCKA